MRSIIYLCIAAIIISCNADDDNDCGDDTLTYNDDIKVILEVSCNNETCHPGAIGGWPVLPDFSSYENLSTYLEGGEIEFRINTPDTILIMPPRRQPERTISDADLEKLNAWICAGFPE